MCGIFGSVFGDGTADIGRALTSLHHRGPDHRAELELGAARFGFVRLAILDLSALGNQPMRSACGHVLMVFNGEVYNHAQLRLELIEAGDEFRGSGDSEVVLAGLARHGSAFIHRMHGMFAIAAFDQRTEELLLIRDRAGKKPLFYAQRGAEVLFASEQKALFAAGLPREVCTQSLAALLTFGYPPAPATMYRGVLELPPGSFMRIRRGKPALAERYYARPFCAQPVRTSVQTALTETRRLVIAAVERRMEADVPLGAFLSGGLDSTIVVGAMARASSAPVQTFSIGFVGDPRYDETAYARIAARAFGTRHTEFALTPDSFDAAARLVHVHDAPFGDSSAIPTAMVSQLTRQHVTVALTGDGGDELFCGYSRFLANEAAGRIPAVLAASLARLLPLVPHSAHVKSPLTKLRRLLGVVDKPLAQRLVDVQPFFAEAATWLVPALQAEQVDCVQFTQNLLRGSEQASVLSQILHHNYEAYLPMDLLVKADRASMLHSLEVRAPFLDTELVDYAARLPDSFKRRGLTTKWILREAFAHWVPKEILKRPKMGFSIPLGAWFRGDLQSYLGDMFAPGARIYAYLQEPRVRELLAEHHAGRADHGSRIWLLLTLELWLRGLEAPALRAAA